MHGMTAILRPGDLPEASSQACRKLCRKAPEALSEAVGRVPRRIPYTPAACGAWVAPQPVALALRRANTDSPLQPIVQLRCFGGLAL